MASYKDLFSTFEEKDNIKEVNINGNIVKVKQYLPIAKKRDIAEITIQNSVVDAIINPIVEEYQFCMNTILMYSDLELDAEDRENLDKVYDTLEQNDVLDLIVGAIPEEEFKILCDYYKGYKAEVLRSISSASGTVRQIIEDLPKAAEKAAAIIKDFDVEQFDNVVNFAAAANAGRPVNNLRTLQTLEEE